MRCIARVSRSKKSVRATEQQRADVVERRARYEEAVEEIDADQLVFIDESGCNVAMTPARAWAPLGERARAFRPMNWGDNVTLIGAVRITGLVALRPMRGSMKTLDFLDFLARDLVPKLRPRDVVVLDNLRQHRNGVVRTIIENAGARVIYLPPYSPELNPIEPSRLPHRGPRDRNPPTLVVTIPRVNPNVPVH